MFSLQARYHPFDDDELEQPVASRRALVFVGAEQTEREGPAPATWWGGGSTPVGAAARIKAALPTLLEVLPANDAELEMLLGQVEAESQFGYAFKTPDGSPSHNWGAIYASGDKGTIPVQDTADGKTFTGGAAWNSSALVGARQFVNLIRGSYGKALERARAGDAWGYALALFRDGKGYYGGFPPGHKWSLAPKGTPLHSPLDHYYRVLAYARMVHGAAQQVAKVLGRPMAVYVNAPPPPSSSAPGPNVATSGGGGGAGVMFAGALALGLGGFVLSRRAA